MIRIIGVRVWKFASMVEEYDELVPYERRIDIVTVEDNRHKRYDISLGTWFGMCGSGYTTASEGTIDIKAISRLDRPTYDYIVINPEKAVLRNYEIVYDNNTEKLKLLDKSFKADSNYYGDDEDIDNEYFYVSSYGSGDSYYPAGRAGVKFENLNLKRTARAMDKRPVWILYGPSGLGKTTVGSLVKNQKVIPSVLETDGLDKLPDVITESFIVLGNRSKFTINDVKKRLFGDPKVILVRFEEV